VTAFQAGQLIELIPDRFWVDVCGVCGQHINGDGMHAHDGRLAPRGSIQVTRISVGDKELRAAVVRFCERADAPRYLREALAVTPGVR
jgi:hypothetical protein